VLDLQLSCGYRTAAPGAQGAVWKCDGANSAHRDSPYSGLPNKLVRGANGIDYVYRDAGTRASGGVPLILFQHFRGTPDTPRRPPARHVHHDADPPLEVIPNGQGVSLGVSSKMTPTQAHRDLLACAVDCFLKADEKASRCMFSGLSGLPSGLVALHRSLVLALGSNLLCQLFGDLAAGLYEDASARLREHPALLRLLNLAPGPHTGGHLDLPAGDEELPATANPITECDCVRSYGRS
jgi:hypothetical protein